MQDDGKTVRLDGNFAQTHTGTTIFSLNASVACWAEQLKMVCARYCNVKSVETRTFFFLGLSPSDNFRFATNLDGVGLYTVTVGRGH